MQKYECTSEVQSLRAKQCKSSSRHTQVRGKWRGANINGELKAHSGDWWPWLDFVVPEHTLIPVHLEVCELWSGSTGLLHTRTPPKCFNTENWGGFRTYRSAWPHILTLILTSPLNSLLQSCSCLTSIIFSSPVTGFQKWNCTARLIPVWGVDFHFELKAGKSSYLKKHGHGSNDPLLPQSCTEAVKVVRVVQIDLHLLEKQTPNYSCGTSVLHIDQSLTHKAEYLVILGDIY